MPLGTSWMWDRNVPTEAQLIDLIEDRIARLTPEQVSALSVAAAGEPLPLALARHAVDPGDLAALEREGIVVLDALGDDDVRLTHPLYGEIVRGRMGPLERTAAYARLVEAASRTEPAPEPARVAVWCLDVGTAVDSHHLVLASERAIALGDGRLARRLAERALAAGDHPEARIALGRSMTLASRVDQATELLTPLLHRAGLPDRERVEAGLWLLIVLRADAERARQVVDTVLDRLDDRTEGDLLRAQWAFTLTLVQRWPEALAISEPLAASARDDVAMRAVQPFVISMAAVGRATTAVDVASAALPRAIEVADTVPEAIRWVFACCVTASLMDGRLADVAALLDLAGGVSAPAGATGYFSMIRGKLALLQGRPQTARTELLAAGERMRREDLEEWQEWIDALLLEATAIGEPAALAAPGPGDAPIGNFDAWRAEAWGCGHGAIVAGA